MPRKMLPPPTTIAISTPSSARAFVTSSAMRCTTSASMPKPIVWSANASPESLSTTRRYWLSVISSSSSSDVDVGRVYSSPILTRAKRRTVRVAARAPSTSAPIVCFWSLTNDCSTQRDRLEEAVELAVDDLGPRLLGLALFAGLRLVDRRARASTSSAGTSSRVT